MLQKKVAAGNESVNVQRETRGQAGKSTRSIADAPAGSSSVALNGSSTADSSLRMEDWHASSLLGAMGLDSSPADGEKAVQRREGRSNGEGEDSALVHRAAQAGLTGTAQALPHAEGIQRSFGSHDVSDIRAHVGGPAAEASRSMGASAYATGSAVAFGENPDLHTAAHEAAHVVQQRGGVQLKGGVGESGDTYERHADAVADRVVRGESAADLLSAAQAGGGTSVQRRDAAPAASGASGAANATAQLEKAISIFETALAVALGGGLSARGDAEPAAATAVAADDALDSADASSEASVSAPVETASGSAAGSGAETKEPPAPATLEQLQTGLRELEALRGAAPEEILRAVTPILAQVGAPEAAKDQRGEAGDGAGSPVQRNTLVLGAPLLAAGPPGWVLYAGLAVVSVGLTYVAYESYRENTRARERAEPRVIPRRDPPQQHRGRLQVQGGGLELSFPWTRTVPMTKAEALAGLTGLQALLSRGQLALRNQAFTQAATFITTTLHSCPPQVTRTFQNRDVRQRDGDERVDIEIRTGVAFV